MTNKSIKSIPLILSVFFTITSYSQSKFKFNPRLEVGIAYRPGVIELSESSKYPNLRTTHAYSSPKHFNNVNLAIALQHYVVKKRISLQLASYFRYNHLYYGKNAQGVSSSNEKEYKRLKYDFFIDGIYHFKKRTTTSVGIQLGIGIGYMNNGTIFKDSALDYNNKYAEVLRGFNFLAPRIFVGVNKNNFSFFAIGHGTPDSEYDGNPTIWLEFKAAYTFSLFKKKKIN
jgi:hypothetical protein